MRKLCYICIFTCFFVHNVVLTQHTTGGLPRDLDPYVIEHKKKARSIVDSNPNGSARSCKNEETILKWLPHDYASDHQDGHYHLLLSATDHHTSYVNKLVKRCICARVSTISSIINSLSLRWC